MVADESGAPPGGRSFRPDVQGLRAVAVGLVVLFHAGVPFLHGGYVGVDVFFVLSGFVITGLLLREAEARRGVAMGDFYSRRARRILPMATLVIIATTAASYLVLGRFVGRGVAEDARWAAVFLANLHAIDVGTDYFHAGGPVSPLLHYWSLAVEEQFYLAFPLLLAAALLLGRSGAMLRRVALLLVAVVGASLALSVLQTTWAPTVAYFSPFTRAWELALGGLCVLASPWAARWPRWAAAPVGWLGVAGILAAGILYGPTTAYPGIAALVPVGATALVVLAGSSVLRRGPESILGTRPFQRGGDLSFSLYLWHWPILVIAAEAVTTPLSPLARTLLVLLAVLLAELSRRLVEDPVRHARRLAGPARRGIGLGLALVVGTVALATVLLAATSVPTTSPAPTDGGHRPSLAAVRAAVADGVATTRVPSDVAPPLGPPTLSLAGPTVPARCVVEEAKQTSVVPCSFGDRSSTTTVLLLGDSTAAMWSSAFIRLAEAQHVRLVLIAKTGCAPWLDPDLIFGGGRNPYCDEWHRFELAEARRLHPAATFVTGYVGEPVSQAAVPDGVTRLLEALGRVSDHVTVLSNLPAVPRGHADPATCVLVHPEDIRPCDLSVAAFQESYGWFRTALEQGAATSGASFVDLDPLFCTSTTCPMVVGRHLVWRDLFHANVAYVGWVSRALGELLGPLSAGPPTS
jgi:peptidoglycan/LPS O-acetylase OafA/YrhL